MMEETAQGGHTAISNFCAICQSPIEAGGSSTECPACRSPYHADCWQENKGCAVYGCTAVPPTEKRDELDIPPSFWGQEHKRCPVCNAEILAAAVRCRHCGSIFSTSRPEERDEYQRRLKREGRRTGLRREAIGFFILAALPCTSWLALIIGWFWYSHNRDEIKRLPGMYSGLCRIGLVISVVEVAVIVVVMALYAVLKG